MESLYDQVLEKRDLAIPEGNAILDELIDFTTSIATDSSPIVSGKDGLLAVDVASQIIRQIKGDASPDFGYRKAG